MNKRKQEQEARNSHGSKGRARIKASRGGRIVVPPSREHVELLGLMRPRFRQISKAQIALLSPEIKAAIKLDDSAIYRQPPRPAPTGAREMARRVRQAARNG
jgi:hypothetical protein